MPLWSRRTEDELSGRLFRPAFQVEGMYDHMNSNHYGGIHGHEICCDLVEETPVFAPGGRKYTEVRRVSWSLGTFRAWCAPGAQHRLRVRRTGEVL